MTPRGYLCRSLTTIIPIEMIQSSVYLSRLVLMSSYFFSLSYEAEHEIQTYIHVKDVYRIFVYYHIYMVTSPKNLRKI